MQSLRKLLHTLKRQINIENNENIQMSMRNESGVLRKLLIEHLKTHLSTRKRQHEAVNTASWA